MFSISCLNFLRLRFFTSFRVSRLFHIVLNVSCLLKYTIVFVTSLETSFAALLRVCFLGATAAQGFVVCTIIKTFELLELSFQIASFIVYFCLYSISRIFMVLNYVHIYFGTQIIKNILSEKLET